MRRQVRAVPVVLVVEVRVEVVRLHEAREHDRGSDAGELAVLLVDVLRDLRHAHHEVSAVGSDRPLDAGGISPRPGSTLVIGPALAELPLDEGLYRRVHVGKVWWA